MDIQYFALYITPGPGTRLCDTDSDRSWLELKYLKKKMAGNDIFANIVNIWVCMV
jgi:hypothetical protein